MKACRYTYTYRCVHIHFYIKAHTDTHELFKICLHNFDFVIEKLQEMKLCLTCPGGFRGGEVKPQELLLCEYTITKSALTYGSCVTLHAKEECCGHLCKASAPSFAIMVGGKYFIKMTFGLSDLTVSENSPLDGGCQ